MPGPDLPPAFAWSMVEAAADGLIVADDRGAIVFANPAACEMFGWPAGELVGAPIEVLVPHALRAEHRRHHARFLLRPDRRPMGVGRTFVAVRRSGDEFPCDIALSPVVCDGQRYVLASVRDTTERERTTAALARSETRMRQLVEQASDGVLVADVHGRYTEVNTAVCELLGYRRDELIGRAMTDLVAPGDAARMFAIRDRLRADADATDRGEWTLIGKDGREVVTEISAKILSDGRWQAFVRDIRERKLAEQALRETTAELERLRAEWNSVVAHDLRQPINSIGLYAQLAETHALRSPDAVGRDVAAIRELVGRLSRMTNDLLDLSRLDASRLTLERRDVDVRACLGAAIERASGLAPDHEIVLEAGDALPTIEADPHRLAQVMDNLLSNAVKYATPATPIVVTAACAGDDVTVSVTNEGPGIAPEDLARLFRRFERIGAAGSKIPGIGLGLQITRGLVEAHGGSISAESELGGRTSFRVRLPIHAVDASARCEPRLRAAP